VGDVLDPKFCDKNVSNSLDSSLVIIEIVCPLRLASNYQKAAYEYAYLVKKKNAYFAS
jgi:hypothetical protein